MKTNPENLDYLIKHTEDDLKLLKRQKRKDCGVKRAKYDSNLPSAYRRYISSANRSGRCFELSLEEFNTITSNSCVYCGNSSRIGVDRRNNSEGYTLENSYPCCTKCNLMKHKHSHEEFLSHIRTVYTYQFG